MSSFHVLWKMKGSADLVLILQKTLNYGVKFLQTLLKISHLFSVAHLGHANYGHNIVYIVLYN